MKLMKRVGVLLLSMVLFLSISSVSFAALDQNTPLGFLQHCIVSGKVLGPDNAEPTLKGYAYTVPKNSTKYVKEDGGFFIYESMVSEDAEATGCIVQSNFDQLTQSAQRDFLADILTIGNKTVAYHEAMMEGKAGKVLDGANNNKLVTADTLNNYSKQIQTLNGAGSQLIASLMAQTKPDYATANRIYEPFAGPIGVILGLLSILIMAFLGVTMALDIAYISIPAFRLALDGGDEGGKEGSTRGMAKIISHEARSAVKSIEDGGDKGQSGANNKAAIGVYFKGRWKSLVILGLCLLYLVQGQIYSFVAWVIDLVSGFVGF